MRRCPAPMAARTAISRRRVVARASWRLATLAVAVISKRATAASSTRMAGRTSAVIACSSGTADTSTGPTAPNSALLKQMVVGMVLDDEGRPICTELWPGNTTDVTTLIPIVDRLKQTFHVEEVCVVADRGMISAQTIDELETRGWTYILGVRMRSSKEAQEIAGTDEGHYHTVFPARRTSQDPAPLRVKQVRRDDRRYIVCFNPDEAEKDRHDREAIVAALEKALAQGDKSLIGNKGFRRFVKTQGTRFTLDDAKITADTQYDGKWVLRTNTSLSMDVVALTYKGLWMVEAIFRSMKS